MLDLAVVGEPPHFKSTIMYSGGETCHLCILIILLVDCLLIFKLVERTSTLTLFIATGINSIQIVYSPSGNLYML